MGAERVDLDVVAERVRQTSEGPWEPSPKVSDAVIAPHADRRPGWDDEDDGYYGGPVVGESMLPADREFIAYARSDVPAMERELRVARTFRDNIAAALAPGRWRGFDGPDGVSKDEVIGDVAAALERHDRAYDQPGKVPP
jgi:hypothetical protein